MEKNKAQKQVEQAYGIDRDKKIAERLEIIPDTYKNQYRKAVKKKALRASVNSLCLECCGYLRKEVTMCTDLACPMYLVRPYQKIVVSEDDIENAG